MSSEAGSSEAKRVAGLDVARALAILGMVTVHFQLVMTDCTPQAQWARAMLGFLDGRPAATFMVLAGMSVAMLAGKAGRTPSAQRPIGSVLRRRGIFLLACGFINLMVWEGDILRIYGVCLLAIPSLLQVSSRALLGWGAGIVITFCIMIVFLDYGKNWDFREMHYRALCTPSGLVRSLFYDGFRSVFPWSALVVLGLWLGRMDWREDALAWRVLRWGVLLWAGSALLSIAFRAAFHGSVGPSLSHEDVIALFGLQSMPPLPLFLINATGVALITIGSCTILASRWAANYPVKALAAMGRMAFTWYVGHIIFGLGGVIVLDWLRTGPGEALCAALCFFAAAATFSMFWLRKFRNGPMESVLRWVG
ncbi:DUF418 domain-containing protein [Luteolibacter soli]|uniref:DUF418 domain-containing protein n=1 Tax=Luteolibacter soli TaxID=3135280 RepID=A0ABU9B2R6_9BACT